MSVAEVYGTVTVTHCSNVEVVCGVEMTVVINETNGCKLVLNEKSIDSDITAYAVSDLVIATVEDSGTVRYLMLVSHCQVETRVPLKIKHKVKGGKASSIVQ